MAKTIGSKNQEKVTLPTTCSLDVQERLELLAKIIVDRITDDNVDISSLIEKVETETYGKAI